MGDKTNQVLPKSQLFRIFRVSYLLPNVKGEKYRFKRISANSWLSPIGGSRKVKRCSSGPSTPIDSKTDQRLEQCQRRVQTAAEIYRKRKREDQLGKTEVLEGIQLKTSFLSRTDRFTNKFESELDSREDRLNGSVKAKTMLDIRTDTSARPKTCPSYIAGYSDQVLGSSDLIITSTVLNKPKCSKDVNAPAIRPSSLFEHVSHRSKRLGTERFVTNERISSAPACLKPLHGRSSSNFRSLEAGSPVFLKSRANTFNFDGKLSPKNEKDKETPNRRAVLRSLLQKSSPAMKHWSGCPFKCKDCFKACLVSEDYYRKLKENKTIQKHPK